MSGYLADIQLVQFVKPDFLWLVALLPILWLRLLDQRLTVILGRTLIGALLILALADPQVTTTQAVQEQERLFAFDLSRSIPPSMRRWMDRYTQGDLAPRPNDRVFLFGADTVQTENWREALTAASAKSSGIDGQKTNLEKLLAAVLALPPRPRNLFLFTDGWETAGSVERLLPLVAGSGIKIFPILPAEPPKNPNVAVTRLQTPNQGNSLEAISIKVALENYGDTETEGSLTLERNGRNIRTERIRLKPGSHLLTYQDTLPEEELASYRATFTPIPPELDNYPSDNHAIASVSVKSKARVLLLNGRGNAGRYLEQILKREGFEVTSRPAESAPPPGKFGIIIFNNAEREKFTPEYLASVEKHVAAGNGFVMLGNEASFSPSAYRNTPIERLLPVDPREPPKPEEKDRAIVLVIDKSGSMREDNRILYAQEAAKAVVRQLDDRDFIGVVGFDVSPFVIIPLSPVKNVRRSFDGDIERLRPGGRTYLLPAINEAKRQLQRQDATHKHVVILSDGETGGAQGDYVDLVSVMRTELKITVSAVAIGGDANLPLMKRITQYGGGFFHHTFDPTSVPRIVLQQIQEKPPSEPPKERELVPVQEPRSELLAGFGERSYPPVLGHMDTELKRGANLDVFVNGGDRRPPLLASWRYGQGKSVALTMDMESRFSRNWIQWSPLEGFWAKILGWVRPEEEPLPLHETRLSIANMRPVLDLYVYQESSANSQFSISFPGKTGGNPALLKKVAPGHFQSTLPISEPGDYKIELTELRQSRRIPLPSLAFSLPYDASAELPRSSFNTALLAQLAEASGGEINPVLPHSGAKAAVAQQFTPKRAPLIATAFLLFFLEVAFRKFVLSEAD